MLPLSDRSFFDTTILIYTISLGDPRALIAEKLLARGGYISVQVLNEFASVGRRKLNMSWKEISDALAAARALCEPVAPISLKTHETALEIAAHFGYRIYDAMIVAAALEANCTILYTEDLQNGQKIGALTIRNPFAIR